MVGRRADRAGARPPARAEHHRRPARREVVPSGVHRLQHQRDGVARSHGTGRDGDCGLTGRDRAGRDGEGRRRGGERPRAGQQRVAAPGLVDAQVREGGHAGDRRDGRSAGQRPARGVRADSHRHGAGEAGERVAQGVLSRDPHGGGDRFAGRRRARLRQDGEPRRRDGDDKVGRGLRVPAERCPRAGAAGLVHRPRLPVVADVVRETGDRRRRHAAAGHQWARGSRGVDERRADRLDLDIKAHLVGGVGVRDHHLELHRGLIGRGADGDGGGAIVLQLRESGGEVGRPGDRDPEVRGAAAERHPRAGAARAIHGAGLPMVGRVIAQVVDDNGCARTGRNDGARGRGHPGERHRERLNFHVEPHRVLVRISERRPEHDGVLGNRTPGRHDGAQVRRKLAQGIGRGRGPGPRDAECDRAGGGGGIARHLDDVAAGARQQFIDQARISWPRGARATLGQRRRRGRHGAAVQHDVRSECRRGQPQRDRIVRVGREAIEPSGVVGAVRRAAIRRRQGVGDLGARRDVSDDASGDAELHRQQHGRRGHTAGREDERITVDAGRETGRVHRDAERVGRRARRDRGPQPGAAEDGLDRPRNGFPTDGQRDRGHTWRCAAGHGRVHELQRRQLEGVHPARVHQVLEAAGGDGSRDGKDDRARCQPRGNGHPRTTIRRNCATHATGISGRWDLDVASNHRGNLPPVGHVASCARIMISARPAAGRGCRRLGRSRVGHRGGYIICAPDACPD